MQGQAIDNTTAGLRAVRGGLSATRVQLLQVRGILDTLVREDPPPGVASLCDALTHLEATVGMLADVVERQARR